MENHFRYGYNFNEPYNSYPSYDPQPYYSHQENFNNQGTFQYNDQECNQWDSSYDQRYYGDDQCDYNQDQGQGYYSNQDGCYQNQDQGDYSNQGGYYQGQDQEDYYHNEDQRNYCDQDGYYQNQEQNDPSQDKSNLIAIMSMLQTITQNLEKNDQELQEVKAHAKMLGTEIAQRNLSYAMPYTTMQDEFQDDEDDGEEYISQEPLQAMAPLPLEDIELQVATIYQVEEPAQEIFTSQIEEVNSTQNSLNQFENDVLNCDANFSLESLMSFDENSEGSVKHEPNELCAQEESVEEIATMSEDIIQEDIPKGEESSIGKEFDGEVDMKPLPSNPRYEFLGPDYSPPTIVIDCINETLNSRLLRVMRRDQFSEMYGLGDDSCINKCWKVELHHWSPLNSCILYVGTKDNPIKICSQEGCAMKLNVFVTENEFIRHDHPKPPKVDWKYFIVDEARRRVRKFILARDFEKCKVFVDRFSKPFKKEGIG